jgi:hypothetical protein
MTCIFNFDTPKSKRRIALILNCLAVQDTDSHVLANICDIARQSIQAFTRHLIAEGLVVIVVPHRPIVGCSAPAVYGLVPGSVVPEIHPDDVSKVPRLDDASVYERRVTILKDWMPMAVPKQSIFAALGI